MKDQSITKSILSISSPGTRLVAGNDQLARQLTRQCNDFSSEIAHRRPEQFGFWAALPLPHIEDSLAEISYALDTLHAAGVTMETNYHGVYLGDPSLDPVFEELNRRKATVFVHPTSPYLQTCYGHGATPISPLSTLYPNPVFEFMFDSARAVVNLFLSGTLARYPAITFVIPHAGGVLPPIIERFTCFATQILQTEVTMSTTIVRETFARQFYFDLAGFAFPDQIHGLLRFVGTDRLLYGSDYPFTPPRGVAGLVEGMTEGMEGLGWDLQVRTAVLTGNARRLLGSREVLEI